MVESTRVKQRSPSYPTIDLGNAVTNARQLWQLAQRRKVSQEDAVGAWGYASLSGPARSRLAALRQYGLTEVDKDGDVSLTRRGQQLAYGADPSSSDYDSALKEAALSPTIFHELYETRRLSSDESIRRHLVLDRKFSEEGAKRLIESFRASLTLAKLDESEFDDETELMPSLESQTTEPFVSGDTNSTSLRPSLIPSQYRWPLYDGVVVEVAFSNGIPTPEDVDLLLDYLDVVKKAMSRAGTRATETETAKEN